MVLHIDCCAHIGLVPHSFAICEQGAVVSVLFLAGKVLGPYYSFWDGLCAKNQAA